MDLARHVREFYPAPENHLGDSASPSEFDRRMLDLLDAIEAGAADIDALIDAARIYTRQQGLVEERTRPNEG